MLNDLEGVSLRAEFSQRISSFSGFRSSHRVPEQIGPPAQRFLQEISQTEFKALQEKNFRLLRQSFGYKRKEMRLTEKPGQVEIGTPDFTYSLRLTLSSFDPAFAIWIQEISEIKTPALIFGEIFAETFAKDFTFLIYRFSRPVNIEDFIDRLEEKDITGVSLDYDSLATWCELTIQGIPGTIRMTSQGLEIGGTRVLELFKQFRSSILRVAQLVLPG